MTRINELSTRLSSIVEIQCRIGLAFEQDIKPDGESYPRFIAEDATGEIDITVNHAADLLACLGLAARALAPVQIRIYVRMCHGIIVGDLRSIWPIDTDKVINAAALIPRIDWPSTAGALLDLPAQHQHNTRI